MITPCYKVILEKYHKFVAVCIVASALRMLPTTTKLGIFFIWVTWCYSDNDYIMHT